MVIPSGYTECQVVAAIDYIANLFAHQFIFPPFTHEDIVQQARFEAVDILAKGKFNPSYNTKKSLDERLLSFLSISVKRRMMNFKRNKMGRSDDNEVWKKKVNLNFFLPLDNIDDQNESNTQITSSISEDMIRGELMELIERELEPEYRPSYFKLLSGVNVSKGEREKLMARLKEILDVEAKTD